jgi:hypothetical protein
MNDPKNLPGSAWSQIGRKQLTSRLVVLIPSPTHLVNSKILKILQQAPVCRERPQAKPTSNTRCRWRQNARAVAVGRDLRERYEYTRKTAL